MTMRGLSATLAAGAAASAIAVFAAYAHPSVSPGDPVAGKKIFLKYCGRCHTLRGAGTKGGIDLDLIKPTYKLVVCFVTKGVAPMPAFGKKGILTAKQIRDVATFVSKATRPNVKNFTPLCGYV